MIFPISDLLCFWKNRSDTAVYNASRNSRRHANLLRYDEIEESLARIIPSSAKIHFFGSRLIGNANHYSDLDIYVEIDNQFFSGVEKTDQRQRIFELKCAMKKHPNWDVTIPLDQATCPVLRCVYLPKHLKCDVTFNNGLAVQYSELLAHFFRIQPQAIKLFHCIRIWFNICELSLKRSQLSIMFVFYLQNLGFLPSVKAAQKGLKRYRIENCEVQFDANRSLEDYGCARMGHFKKYFCEFFEYYAEFNFDEHVINPYHGQPARKLNFSNQRVLKRNGKEISDFMTPMAMSGILGSGYNFAWDIGKGRLKEFVKICECSVLLLDNNC